MVLATDTSMHRQSQAIHDLSRQSISTTLRTSQQSELSMQRAQPQRSVRHLQEAPNTSLQVSWHPASIAQSCCCSQVSRMSCKLCKHCQCAPSLSEYLRQKHVRGSSTATNKRSPTLSTTAARTTNSNSQSISMDYRIMQIKRRYMAKV